MIAPLTVGGMPRRRFLNRYEPCLLRLSEAGSCLALGKRSKDQPAEFWGLDSRLVPPRSAGGPLQQGAPHQVQMRP